MGTVVVGSIESPWWSERAIAAGHDDGTGEAVTFALAKDRAKKLARAMQAGETVRISVPEGDVLFRRPLAQTGLVHATRDVLSRNRRLT